MTASDARDLGPLRNVSRETRDKLELYADRLDTWSRRINLVSPKTLPEKWRRHFADSAQLCELAPEGVHTWADLGSGGGFPGLVVSLLRPEVTVTLIESDKRKATFLRGIIRETGANAHVLAERIEHAMPQGADVVSARALAPLDRLVAYAVRHLGPDGTTLFLKGRQFRSELQEALESWRFDCKTTPSRTETGAVILTLTEITRV
ncbi:MAG: 16S rRNA (guanine(527)-N(7))-methyltransferase RsmG [Pseudomonadota bacterium]